MFFNICHLFSLGLNLDLAIPNNEIRSTINKLRNTSPDHDFLPMSLFEDNFDPLIDVINYILNLSLSKRNFPGCSQVGHDCLHL